MENKFRVFVGALSGFGLASAIIGIHQESFGSREGYIQYLQTHWIDCTIWFPVFMLVLAILTYTWAHLTTKE